MLLSINVPVASTSSSGVHKPTVSTAAAGRTGLPNADVLIYLGQGHPRDHALQPSLTAPASTWQPPLITRPLITDFLNHVRTALPSSTEAAPKQGPHLAIPSL